MSAQEVNEIVVGLPQVSLENLERDTLVGAVQAEEEGIMLSGMTGQFDGSQAREPGDDR